MREPSLQEIMNRMARRHEALRSRRLRAGLEAPPATALDAFIAVDPVLAGLNKELLDAVAYRDRLALLKGADDPMAVVAADMADSLQSAVDTRLIEVREDARLRRLAVRKIVEARRERKKASLLYKRKMEEFYAGQAAEARKRKAKESFASTMFLWWMLWYSLQNTRRALSLANDFSTATSPARIAGTA